MSFTHDDVAAILKIIDSSSLDAIDLDVDGLRLSIRRNGAGAAAPATAIEVAAPRASTQAPPAPAPPVPAPTAAHAPLPAANALREGQFALTAPMLGTFYRAPSPGAAPFVDIGSSVREGDTLCIIEVMKLMNTIKAERAGRVAAIPAANATLVEYGAPLIVFDPA